MDHDDPLERRRAVEAALDLRREALDGRGATSIDLGNGIAGLTLAEDLTASADRPPHGQATMDGFAFDATDGYPLDLVGTTVSPGDDPPSIEPGQAVRVATGAPVPSAANAVLKVEEATVDDGRLTGPAIDPGTYVYERASNVAAGERLFERGERLSAGDAVLLADLGYDSVPVVEPWSVGILATGTEIHEGRSTDLDSGMLAELVGGWGHDPAFEGTVPDEYARVEERIADAAERHDVVVTSGGTSVGGADHVVRALRSLGDVRFHRVAIRPGKPVAVARLPDREALAVAIPGKPVGALAAATLVARPLFAGRTDLPSVPATLTSGVRMPVEGFEYSVPVALGDTTTDGTGDADRTALPVGGPGSELSVYGAVFDPSVLSSATRATRADGFVLTDDDLAPQERVGVVPYPVLA